MKAKKIPLKKPTSRQVQKFILNSIIIVVGNAITAAASVLFIVPNNFAMGGTTGVGIFIRNLLVQYASISAANTEWIVNITVYVANLILFVVGVIFLGKKFAVSTLAGTLLYPAFMSLFNLIDVSSFLGDDLMLNAVCGGILFGLGIGVVVRVGSSTGGTDIPPLILQKYFNMPVSTGLWIIDISIVLIQIVASDFNMILYGFIITLLSSVVIEKVAPIGMRRTQVKIVSNRYLEIRDMILTKISRGVTVLYGQTGYLEQECHVLLTVISHRQLVMLKAEVQRIDPDAFMTISEVSEVRGRGFHSEGVDFLMPQDKANPNLPPPPEEHGGPKEP